MLIDNQKRYLIAEIGINHNGSYDTAKNLISEAAAAGADAIKFQYRSLKNAYSSDSVEIGDEVLQVELAKNYLDPKEIEKLIDFAKEFSLDVGISFFDVKDISDFSHVIQQFDFFKIPSVELLNLELINTLLTHQKTVLISTGAHQEAEIESIFNNLASDNWIPMHCVSNYPTINVNSKLGYINYLTKKWGKIAGYSSHDENWELCLLAFSAGAKIIERHITLNKYAQGLDHTTSSLPNEFLKISNFMDEFVQISQGNSPRQMNQGELINRQNLGKSYFALKDFKVGELLDEKYLAYHHPKVGISREKIKLFVGKKFFQDCNKGAAITESHFKKPIHLKRSTIDHCEQLQVALPVRFHDYELIATRFPLNNFELHLSANDVKRMDKFEIVNPLHKFSIHFPDYQNSTQLLDPFSTDSNCKKRSIDIIEKIKRFAIQLSEKQNDKVILVASFSSHGKQKSNFYEMCRDLQSDFDKENLILAYQWLPPYAWYFGGSKSLTEFNNISDLDFIVNNKLNICLDTSHLLLSSTFYGFDPLTVLRRLSNQIVQFHLADAKGFDGEGFQIGEGDAHNLELFNQVFKFPQRKVLEPWQGHLNLYSGFYEAIETIGNFYDIK